MTVRSAYFGKRIFSFISKNSLGKKSDVQEQWGSGNNEGLPPILCIHTHRHSTTKEQKRRKKNGKEIIYLRISDRRTS